MAIFKRTGRAVLISSLLSSTAAFADVTAQDVWEDWKANLALYGEGAFTVGEETMDGDTLTVSGISLEFADEDAVVTADLGEMTFTEQGDGTVAVGVPTSMPMTLETNPMYGDPVNLTMSATQEGVEIIVSGSPEEMTYDLTAARYTLSLDSIEGDDEMVLNAVELSMSDITGSFTTSEADSLRNVDYALSSGQINVVGDIAENGGPGMFQLLGTIDGLDVEATASVPVDIDMDSPESVFVDGLAVDVGYTFGASNYQMSFAERTEEFSGTASASGGSMNFAMDKTGVAYSGGATEPAVTFEGSEVPFPIEVSMAEYGYGLELPLSASEEPRDFGLNVLLSEVAVNDMIWSMIDPGNALPHDPATVSVDISGAAKLFFDVLDPEQMMGMMSADMPGEIESLNLNDLTIRIAGAEVLGSGSFTFDNSDLETFDGFPRPIGSVEVAVNGANGLMDTLVEMGLVPEEQIMGARMMIGMFAKSVGDDMMESKLEINEQGHIIANGQRIQ